MTNPSPPQPSLNTVLSIEEYTGLFSQRYTSEPYFRGKVHEYLRIPRSKIWALSIGKNLAKGWYEKETQGIVGEYARKVREDVLSGLEAFRHAEEAEKLEGELALLEDGLAQVVQEAEEKKEIYGLARDEAQRMESKIEEEHSMSMRTLESEYEERIKSIVEGASAEMIARENLQQFLERSSYFQKDPRGALSFVGSEMVKVFEEMYLDEILEGIEAEEGSGFVSKLKQTYSDIIERFDRIESISELPDTDWVESIKLSRIKGYNLPTYPHLITGKPKSQSFKSTLDTAIGTDTSASMDDNHKHEIAKKTCLSVFALMRRLNPKNATYLARFDASVRPLTPEEYIKMEKAEGSCTRTDLCLDWIFKSLNPSGWGLGHLITDGAPTGPADIMERCIRAAAGFKENPNILLRIYLIEGNRETEENIRLIGRAAGPDTKVIPIKNYQLGGSVIKGISDSIGKMYSIMDF